MRYGLPSSSRSEKCRFSPDTCPKLCLCGRAECPYSLEHLLTLAPSMGRHLDRGMEPRTEMSKSSSTAIGEASLPCSRDVQSRTSLARGDALRGAERSVQMTFNDSGTLADDHRILRRRRRRMARRGSLLDYGVRSHSERKAS
jgi:hypothetical protein